LECGVGGRKKTNRCRNATEKSFVYHAETKGGGVQGEKKDAAPMRGEGKAKTKGSETGSGTKTAKNGDG